MEELLFYRNIYAADVRGYITWGPRGWGFDEDWVVKINLLNNLTV